MASDGHINLRAEAKAHALVERYGEKKFAYAGNSKDDLYVWKKAGEVIAVNAPMSVLKHLNRKVDHNFPQTVNQTSFFVETFSFCTIGAVVPVILSYILGHHTRGNHIIYALAIVTLTWGLSTLGQVLSMHAVSYNKSHTFIDALKRGRITIGSAIRRVGLLLGIGVILISLLPGRVVLSTLVLSTAWLGVNMYPSTVWIKRGIGILLLYSIFCIAFAHL